VHLNFCSDGHGKWEEVSPLLSPVLALLAAAATLAATALLLVSFVD